MPSNGKLNFIISPYSLLINHIVSHHFIQSNMCVMTLETLKERETRLLFIYLLKTLSINSLFVLIWYFNWQFNFFFVHSWRRHSYVVIKIIVMSNYKTGCTVLYTEEGKKTLTLHKNDSRCPTEGKAQTKTLKE